MKLLALDSSAAQCAVICMRGETVLASLSESLSRGHAERLMPMARAVLEESGLTFRQLDALAVGIGPGNFTGIRIAIAAVRGLALALDIPAIGVTTFEALAADAQLPCMVCLDAGMGRVYAQIFPNGKARAPELLKVGRLRELNLPDHLTVLGHDASAIAASIGARAGSGVTLAPIEAIARVARSRPGPHTAPAPLYLRGADAAPAADPPPLILDDA